MNECDDLAHDGILDAQGAFVRHLLRLSAICKSLSEINSALHRPVVVRAERSRFVFDTSIHWLLSCSTCFFTPRVPLRVDALYAAQHAHTSVALPICYFLILFSRLIPEIIALFCMSNARLLHACRSNIRGSSSLFTSSVDCIFALPILSLF